MTSVYTELTKEAGRRGGPAALRAFYRLQGVAQGVARGRLEGFAEGVALGRLEGFAEGVALGRWKGRTEGVIIGAAATGLGVIGAVVHEKRRVRRASAETAPTAMPEEDTTGVPAPEQRTDA
ncbi:hypothetical protein QFZ63_006445 [Streptomyces sp. B3I7]|uniref:hypothetical protein n=1 Tax=Streptomyces sp. B3I7 TaxID=3042269 RepID=UPI00277EEC7D|nr:hypothetical protein [Streptomyces sp. B3I7]MDQ0814731.1 hypothetical protein [Streptomyces sp. B3I7]